MATIENFSTFGFLKGKLGLTEENWRKFFKPIVYDSVQNGLTVTSGSEMTINIAAGECRCGGVMGYLDNAISLDIEPADSTFSRIDSVIAEYTRGDTSSLVLTIITGTPSASPVAPTLTKDYETLWQMEIAQIVVPANATSASQIAVSDKRNIYDGMGTMASKDDAPSDNIEYVRKNGEWVANSGGSYTGATWGTITGSISTQTDLINRLNQKANIADLGNLAYFDVVSLSTQVEHILPIAHGGTGVATTSEYWTQLDLGNVAGLDIISLTTNVDGILPIENGGTGASTSTGARYNLGLGKIAELDKISLTTEVEGILPITNGGTNASTTTGVWNNLNLGYMAGLNKVSLTTDVNGILPLANGGTGVATTSEIWTQLDLGRIAGLDTISLTSDISGILPIENGGTNANNSSDARYNLGLGDLATLDKISLTTQVEGILPLSNGGTGVATTSEIWTQLDLGRVAGLDTISLSADVTDILPIVNGGTGVATTTEYWDELDLGYLAGLDKISLSNDVEDILPIAYGGTGVATTTEYWSKLDLGTMAKFDDAPSDSSDYVRRNGEWVINSGGSGLVSLTTGVTGILPIANGGTNASTTTGVWNELNLGYVAGLNKVSLSNDVEDILPIVNGGTGVATTTEYWTQLDLGYVAGLDIISLSANVADILPITNGGSGASNTSDAWNNFNLGSMAGINDAPVDEYEYVRKAGRWVINTGGASASTFWGSITGSISTQTDLVDVLNEKANIIDLGDLAYLNSVSLTTQVDDILPMAHGGTGVATTTEYWTQLDLGDVAGLDIISLSSNVIDILPISNGGSGASNTTDVWNNFNLKALAGKDDVPYDDIEYVRKNGEWIENTSIKSPVSLTTQVDGILPIINGGTGGSTTTEVWNNLSLGYIAGLNKVSLSNDIEDILPITNGGTGVATTTEYWDKLDLGKLAGLDKVSLSDDIEDILPLSHGGTGVATTSEIWNQLDLGNIAGLDTISLSSNVIDILPLTNGGTGVATTSEIWTQLDLGVVAGLDTVSLSTDVTDILPITNGGTGVATTTEYWNELDLGFIAGLDVISLSDNIADILSIEHGGTNASTSTQARENLGLGSMALVDDVISNTTTYLRKADEWVPYVPVNDSLITLHNGTGEIVENGSVCYIDEATGDFLKADANCFAESLYILSDGDCAIDGYGKFAYIYGTVVEILCDDTIEHIGSPIEISSTQPGYATKTTSVRGRIGYTLESKSISTVGLVKCILTGAVIPVENGGTGATTDFLARNNLGLGDLSVLNKVSLSANVEDILPLTYGGTGVATTSEIWTQLDLGTMAGFDDAPSDSSDYVRRNGTWVINSGSGGLVSLTTGVTGILPISNGGTGVSTSTEVWDVLSLSTMAGMGDAPSDSTDYVRRDGQWVSSISINNSGSHNCVYRGKYLGNTVTTAQYEAINSGEFTDMFIGDYWTIGAVNYRIAAFDYWYNTGDTKCTTHHIVIVPDTAIAIGKINSTNTVTGAYAVSDFYTGNNANTAKAAAINIANGAFGSAHILSHREYFANSTTNGLSYCYEDSGSWYDSTVDLMNENMVYGHNIYHATQNNGSIIPAIRTIDKTQLPLFQYKPDLIEESSNWWLRDVSTYSNFACVTEEGLADSASASSFYDIRPVFAIKA